MRVDIEKSQGIDRSLKIEIPIESLNKKFQSLLNKVVRTAHIDGFRPGKAPEKLILQRYEGAIRQDMLEEVLNESLRAALEQEKFTPVSTPKIRIDTFEKEKPFIYHADFEVYPVIFPVNLREVTLEQWNSEVTEGDIDAAIERLRKRMVKWEKIDRSAQNGDKVETELSAFSEGKPIFKDQPIKNIPFVIGAEGTFEEISKALVGAVKDQHLTVNIKPEASKPNAEYQLKILNIYQPILPELNDDMAKKSGEAENLSDLRNIFRSEMQKELEGALKIKNKHEVFEKWLNLNSFSVPQGLIQSEIESLRKEITEQFQKQTQSHAMPNIEEDALKSRAERRVKLGLLFEAFVEAEKIAVTPDEIEALMRANVKNDSDFQRAREWYQADKARLRHLEQLALEDKVVRQLAASAKMNPTKVAYEDALFLARAVM